MIKICTVVGARPQFIKYAALHYGIKNQSQFKHSLIHTGQHYDATMDGIFFDELELPKPNVELNIGSHNPSIQIALMLKSVADHLMQIKPDYLIVFGDTNSSLAGAIAAAKLNIPIIHIEAGARSFNMDMPEEANRIIIDRLSSVLFASSEAAMHNLKKEGMADNAVFIGDVMKDMVCRAKTENKIMSMDSRAYIYATIHRPSNVDDHVRLLYIFNALNQLNYKVILPLHPRTKHQILTFNIDMDQFANVECITPVGYFENLSFIRSAQAVITDSGGMQKEAYWLQTKCITLRKETEWVETLHDAWNTLVYDQLQTLNDLLEHTPTNHVTDLYGVGDAVRKIIKYLDA